MGKSDAKHRQPEPPQAFRAFADRYPAVVEAYERLGEQVRAVGPLTSREVALVKLAISLGARMEGAAHAHTRKALAEGIDRRDLEHVALLTCPTIGFPNMMTGMGWVRDSLEGR